jgi:hypothetical protein
MLLDHVQVVEQPLAGGTYVDLVIGGPGQPGVGIVQDAAGFIETVEQPRLRPAGSADDALAGRESASPFGQMLGPQQVPPNRSGDQLFRARAAGKNAGDERRRC